MRTVAATNIIVSALISGGVPLDPHPIAPAVSRLDSLGSRAMTLEVARRRGHVFQIRGPASLPPLIVNAGDNAAEKFI